MINAHRPAEVTRWDRLRQGAVVIAAGVAVAGGAAGGGALGGTPISEVAGGALDTDATLVAPGGPAFAVWSVIYVGLVAYAVVQALPSFAADPRQRRVGWWVAASMLLNGAWIGAVQAEMLVLSCAVIIALVAVLAVVYVRTSDRRTGRTGPTGLIERSAIDGTTGIYLGWASIATIANIAATLAAEGVVPLGIGPETWAVVVLIVGAAVGVGLAVRGVGRFSAVAGLCWGLAWIGAERLVGAPTSVPTAVAAISAAAVVVLVAVVVATTGSRRAVAS